MPSQLANVGADVLKVITDPIQAKINQTLDQVIVNIRAKIASDKKIALNKVTDLEISEYLLAMPFKDTNVAIDESVGQSGKIIAGSIVIGFSLLALAVFFSRK
jgi:hypothetical protein